MTFDEAFDILIGHEGGYSNHPNDPGGETMWGVTKRVAQANGYTGAMKDYPRDKAKDVYRSQYWDKVKADDLPEVVRYDVFDAAVNSGTGQSVKWLQAAAGVNTDGSLGPLTLTAVDRTDPWKLKARFNGHRLQMMAGLAGWSSFSKGWARRVAANLLQA